MWRKARIPLALLLVLVVVTHADTPPGGKEQLRKLAKLPVVDLRFGYSMDSVDDLMPSGATLDPVKEIASLQKAMQGGPPDAERYFRLSQLYMKQDQSKDKAGEALDKSIALFRQRVDQQPENGRLLTDFGEALGFNGNNVEAEHVLRKAAAVATNDWHVWVNLGSLLQGKALSSLYNEDNANFWSPEALAKLAANARPLPNKLKQSQAYMDEAMKCYDNAATVAPKEPEVFLKRAWACSVNNRFRAIIAEINGDDSESGKKPPNPFAGVGVVENLQEAARLNPKNYNAIGALVIGEIVKQTSQPVLSGNFTTSLINSLPDKSQKIVRDGMTCLQKLEDDPDKRVAAGALETEGAIEFTLMSDRVNGEQKLRRALALDPSRDRAAEMLTGLLAQSKNFTEMLTVCEARANQNPTPRNLLLLAKAHEMLGHTAEAEKQMEAAVKLAPDDFDSQIGLGAMLLHHTDDDSLARAADHIRLAKAALAKLPGGTGTADQVTNYYFTAGLYQGLAGNTDRARDAFRLILEHDPANENAKAALAALGN
jgi:tetratricopeptide (TPR) repeat protein